MPEGDFIGLGPFVSSFSMQPQDVSPFSLVSFFYLSSVIYLLFIYFINPYRRAPNWDQVLVLKSQVWPLIRRCLPDAILRVYGAWPAVASVAAQTNNDAGHPYSTASVSPAVFSLRCSYFYLSYFSVCTRCAHDVHVRTFACVYQLGSDG